MNKITKIGFLPLYLYLYEQSSPGSVDEFSPFVKTIGELLGGDGIEVTTAPAAFDPAHITRASGLFTDVDLIVTLHLAYSPSMLSVEFLANAGVPVLILDVTRDDSLTGMPDDFLMKNHGIHGVMDLTSVLYRRGVDYTVIAGHPNQPEFRHRLSEFVAGVRAAELLQDQTIGITGKPFVGMGDFAVNFSTLRERFAIETVSIDKESIVLACGEVSTSAIENQRQLDLETCDAAGIEQDIHERDIRSFLAIKKQLDEVGATGYTMNFQHVLDGIPVPFYACSRLQALGYGYGGEGDVLTAALGLPLNAVATSKFDEFFCPDWNEDGILMSHMGETDPRFAEGTIKLGTRTGFLNQMDSVIFRFKAAPGPLTFASFTPGREKDFKIVSGVLDIVEFPVLDQIEGPHYLVRTRGPLTTFLEEYAAVGGGHHVYVSQGDVTLALRTMSGILDFEYHEIGTRFCRS